MAEDKEATIFLSELFPAGLPETLRKRFAQLCMEAVFLMAFALLFPYFLGISQGAMLALFMVSSSLIRRANQLMAENRENIWEKKLGGWAANYISVVSILALFSGIFLATVAFTGIVVSLGSPQSLEQFFDFILKVQNLQQNQPVAHRFSSFQSILLNNALVLLTTIMLGLIYRIYGMILVLSWNACVWAVVILYVFREAWMATKISTASFVALSIAGMLPHLLLEASAYILAALAAVFISQAFTKYKLSDQRFKRVAKASLTLFAAATAVLFLAALVEAYLPPALLSF